MVACNGDCRNACTWGCVGCGLCVLSCKFDAVHLNDRGIAVVDEDQCIACGACARACPQGLIRIHECANPIVVKCANRDKAPAARTQCEVSCIGCGLCERTCTAGAIHVVDHRAVIDEELCLSCGMCAVKCPRRAIRDLRGILTARA